MVKMTVSYEGEIKPHGYLSNGAWFMLDKALSMEEGRYYYLCSSLLFSAFTMESYLNYIGKKHINCWAYIEKISTIEKMKFTCENKKIDIDWGKRPYQTITELFKFRNALAHARPTAPSGKAIINEEDFETFDIKEMWEEYPTVECAQKAKSDILIIMETLKSVYKDDSPILDCGSFSFNEEK